MKQEPARLEEEPARLEERGQQKYSYIQRKVETTLLSDKRVSYIEVLTTKTEEATGQAKEAFII